MSPHRSETRPLRPALALVVPADALGHARDLNENLAGLYSLLKQLFDLAEQKLAAMRAASDRTLQACAAQEAQLLEEVKRLEQQRTATLARLAQALRAPQLEHAALSEVAAQFPEPVGSALRARNAALQDIARKLQQKNRLAARVAQHLQSHIRAVFAAVAKANQESVVYGPKGQHEQVSIRSCLDAVG